MPVALAMVKRELGSEAMILHTRSYKRGGVLGIGAKAVVEITATDDPQVGRRKRRGERGAPASRAPDPHPAAGDLIRRTYAAAQSELGRQRGVASSPSPGLPAAALTGAYPTGARANGDVMPASGSGGGAGGHAEGEQLADDLRAVKRMVKQMVMQQRQLGAQPTGSRGAQAGRDMPDKLFDQYLSLLEQQVTEELAEEVIGQVRERLEPGQHEEDETVYRVVLEVIAKQIPTDDTAGRLEPVADGRPRTIALVGPTGVGKTTTIAKLAATFKLKQKKNVGLITLDTYRIAAVDQLRTYANIIGIPLHVATSPQELSGALGRCAGCDVVLIDTAGRSQRNDPRLDELKALIQVANPHEVHLVLSSTCSQSVLLDVVERFSAIQTDRIIFTKLDEAVSFGVLLNVARKVNKRLSYFTTGQEVPHQIEPSCPQRLAALVLGRGQTC